MLQITRLKIIASGNTTPWDYRDTYPALRLKDHNATHICMAECHDTKHVTTVGSCGIEEWMYDESIVLLINAWTDFRRKDRWIVGLKDAC
jgi:hypothetical protein